MTKKLLAGLLLPLCLALVLSGCAPYLGYADYPSTSGYPEPAYPYPPSGSYPAYGGYYYEHDDYRGRHHHRTHPQPVTLPSPPPPAYNPPPPRLPPEWHPKRVEYHDPHLQQKFEQLQQREGRRENWIEQTFRPAVPTRGELPKGRDGYQVPQPVSKIPTPQRDERWQEAYRQAFTARDAAATRKAPEFLKPNPPQPSLNIPMPTTPKAQVPYAAEPPSSRAVFTPPVQGALREQHPQAPSGNAGFSHPAGCGPHKRQRGEC